MATEFVYDVYISYNTIYRDVVEQIAMRLRDEYRLKVWVDFWCLKPGDDWQQVARQTLPNTRAVLVLIGPAGIGPNSQMKELEIILSSQVQRIIPVLLPDTPTEVIPAFLKSRMWVDFREGLDDRDAWQILMTGIFPLMAPPTSSDEEESKEGEQEGDIIHNDEAMEEAEIDMLIGMVEKEGIMGTQENREEDEVLNEMDLRTFESYLKPKPNAKSENRGQKAESPKGETINPPRKERSSSRVLNANFADPKNKNRLHELNKCLLADQEYNLRVDIGSRWDLSLFKDDVKAVFPGTLIKEKLLTAEDIERGAFDVKVVFVSEEFTPKLVTAMMSVPIDPTLRSIPYIKGQLAKRAGWVSLRVRAPKLPVGNLKAKVTAHGRLCLYYQNNLLQSGAIHVGVASEPDTTPQENNRGEIDFVLTNEFDQVEESFNAPVSISEGVEQKISLNLALNEDGSGSQRIIAMSELTGTPITMPAAWMPYNLTEAKYILNRARQALLEIIKPLANKPTKNLADLKKDLERLAIVGSRIRNTFILSTLYIEEDRKKPQSSDDPGMTGLQWTNLLLKKLAEPAVIQIARTGPASFVFPWALFYEYSMEGPNYEPCKILDEEWSTSGKRNKPAGTACPYANEAWHKQNIVCPYGFWGLKHVIEQPPSGLRKIDDTWRSKASERFLTTNGFPITVIATDDVKQEQFKQHLENLGKLKNVRFDPLKPVRDKAEAEKVLREPQVIYFLCHGEWEPKDLQKRERAIPYLSIGKHDDSIEHKIFPTTLTNWGGTSIDAEAWAHQRPLVIINGCETANINPDREFNFVEAFDYLGASGVIGTEVSMLVDTAYTVAEEIIAHLADHKQIGLAIREMRWKLLNEGNVIGLAYTPYCRAKLHYENE